jgi:hypothetical protein
MPTGQLWSEHAHRSIVEFTVSMPTGQLWSEHAHVRVHSEHTHLPIVERARPRAGSQ